MKKGVVRMAVKETDLKQDLHTKLNQQLANWAVTYFKLHHFHWFVKGGHFQTLHAKFEELYHLAASNLDELAERMLAIGIQPVSSMKEFLSAATIKENETAGQSAEAMLESVIADFGQMAGELLAAAKLAEDKSGDSVTADLLREHVKEIQKQIWMLNATLGK